MTEPILRFVGEYRFLSNFYYHMYNSGRKSETTVEHHYQAAKTDDVRWKRRILLAGTPGGAKKLGRQCPIVDNWDEIKLMIMYRLVYEKFSKNMELEHKLIITGDAELQEGNDWGDFYWGVCKGTGENHLGKILMLVRKELILGDELWNLE